MKVTAILAALAAAAPALAAPTVPTAVGAREVTTGDAVAARDVPTAVAARNAPTAVGAREVTTGDAVAARNAPTAVAAREVTTGEAVVAREVTTGDAVVARGVPTAVAARNALTARAANTAFGGIAINSGTAIQLSAINATGNEFWIGKDTYTYCPSSVVDDCPEGKWTYFSGGNGTLSLAAEVPGGQQVFVNVDGSLGYTVPHSDLIPFNASSTGFSLAEGGLHLQYHGGDFVAVPIGSAYKVYAATAPDVPKNGTGFVFRVEQADVEYEAWEY